jgi:hypothetical protein
MISGFALQIRGEISPIFFWQSLPGDRDRHIITIFAFHFMQFHRLFAIFSVKLTCTFVIIQQSDFSGASIHRHVRIKTSLQKTQSLVKLNIRNCPLKEIQHSVHSTRDVSAFTLWISSAEIFILVFVFVVIAIHPASQIENQQNHNWDLSASEFIDISRTVQLIFVADQCHRVLVLGNYSALDLLNNVREINVIQRQSTLAADFNSSLYSSFYYHHNHYYRSLVLFSNYFTLSCRTSKSYGTNPECWMWSEG